MLFGRQVPRVFVYEYPVDMRKSFDGLHAIASQVSQEDALSGLLFLFVNRSKTIMKILFWDRTGWCVVAKRLERG
jgi:transposase